MPALFNDYDFGKARQDEMLSEAKAGRITKLAGNTVSSKVGVKDRVLLLFGNALITAGWKLRRAGCRPNPCPEPSRG